MPTGMSLRRLLGAGTVLVLTLSLTSAPARAAEDYPFRNPGLPLAQRIGDLLGRLTLDEKISWLHQYTDTARWHAALSPA